MATLQEARYWQRLANEMVQDAQAAEAARTWRPAAQRQLAALQRAALNDLNQWMQADRARAARKDGAR